MEIDSLTCYLPQPIEAIYKLMTKQPLTQYQIYTILSAAVQTVAYFVIVKTIPSSRADLRFQAACIALVTPYCGGGYVIATYLTFSNIVACMNAGRARDVSSCILSLAIATFSYMSTTSYVSDLASKGFEKFLSIKLW